MTADRNTGRDMRGVLVASAGNLVEWYDFYVYSAFSLYFVDAFFPGDDPVAQMLSASGVFALGFLMRPLGALVFGRIGDRRGRRTALMLSVLLMCAGSSLIALLPTYASIGVAAPALLLVARLLQGASLGGEYGSSATWLAEAAPRGRRGFYSSFQYVTMIAGQLLALGVLLFLQNIALDDAALRQWGWRIPFAIGGLLAIATLWLRRDLSETTSFAATQGDPTRGSLRALLEHRRETATVVGLTLGGTIAFYVYTSYMQKFLKLSVGLSAATTTWVTAGSLIFALVLQPVYGALSDRIGRRPMLIAFGALGALFTTPLLIAIRQADSAWRAFMLICFAWLIVGLYTSINAVVKADLFPAAIRVTGVALPYALTVSVFGGSAEFVALWFKSRQHEEWFFYYASAAIFMSLLVYATMPETGARPDIDREERRPSRRDMSE
jgi:MHS family alpha-ketoglutarate permease-like MFS transporter